MNENKDAAYWTQINAFKRRCKIKEDNYNYNLPADVKQRYQEAVDWFFNDESTKKNKKNEKI